MSPRRVLHQCSAAGCTALIREGNFCSVHRAKFGAVVRRRGVARLYDGRWAKHAQQLLDAQPWCVECKKAGRLELATDVHHVERHDSDPEKFWRGATINLCHSCHSRITASEMAGAAKKVS